MPGPILSTLRVLRFTSSQPCKVGSIILSLQMEKLSHRDINLPKVSEQVIHQAWIFNPFQHCEIVSVIHLSISFM